MNSYQDYLHAKHLRAESVGLVDVPPLAASLFPFQRDIVTWALRRGRAAIFADCGLGKGWMALEWARVVANVTAQPVLIVAPLAVAQQFVREAAKLGLSVTICRDGDDVRPGINVTNYDRLHRFDDVALGGVVLDESSILKDHTSATRNMILARFAATPFRLACTATPAPNDFMELGNHAEFLGTLSRQEMLATFFTHDGGETQAWRLKGHAERDFWRWVASWAVCVRTPSDLGYDDGAYRLPPLHLHEHRVTTDNALAHESGLLFAVEAQTLDAQRAARKASLTDRVAIAADLVNASAAPWIVWCDLNVESEALARAIPGAVEVRGSDDADYKERASLWFTGAIACPCGEKTTTESGIDLIRSGALSVSPMRAPTSATIETSDAHICSGTSESTGSGRKSLRGSKRNEASGTPHGAIDTVPTRNIARAKGRRLDVATRCGSETEGCAQSSGSIPIDIPPCLPSKVGDAPSAGGRRMSTRTDNFMSTTATRRDEFGDSCAPRVTSGSENSTTTPSGWNGRRCTCGRPLGTSRVLISKSSIFGHGLNWQHCAHVAFVGLSHSFEAYYQALRRTYRFGQTRPVHVHLITSTGEGAVLANLKRKQAEAETLHAELVAHLEDFTAVKAAGRELATYRPHRPLDIPEWLVSEAA